ncbi:FHA domain-containing protein [Ktedonospora formicarum]|uniref:FHA domain-containing protein n=1 Tax=Ktedonospora formicarum TaxID=2778364 RepID=A0A8J3I4F0_9CHLR|nr:FHA domain-containing protein [Ktedonospora formicarum]GHO50027.1 hypothetical protein KSX_81900 [Ktedonospora formicarum]
MEPEPAHPQEPSIPIQPETPRPHPQEPEVPAKPQIEPIEQPMPGTLPRPEPDIVQPIPTTPFTPQPDIRPNEEPQQSLDTGHQTYEEHELAYLVITSPYQETPQQVLLETGSTLNIGRAGSSDILLEQDNLTSRHHALLKHENNQFYILDQRSAKGVFVNGRKLISGVGCALHDGDNINIGRYTLTFHYKPAKNATPPSYAVPESA